MKPLIKARDLRAYYYITVRGRERSIRAVDGVSIDIYEDEVLGVIGESGSGKSTLADVIMMNIRPPLRLISGKILFYDEKGELELSAMTYKYLRDNIFGKKISMAPQYAMSALPPAHKVWKIAEDIFTSHGVQLPKEEIIKILQEKFESLGLPPAITDRYPFELSGGMRQRVVLAMSTLLKPKLLIADEIIAALDVATAKQVIETMKLLKKQKHVTSIMMISHDVPAVVEIADRIAIMYAGKIIEVSSAKEIVEDAKHPYSKMLLESIVTIESKRKQLRWVPGDMPDLSNPPPGCRFHPRCPFAMDICKKEEPPSMETREGHYVSCWLYVKR
jgi:peptide/nickel transport system ATP-binding protein